MTYPPTGGTPDPSQPPGQQPAGGPNPYQHSDPYAAPSSGGPPTDQPFGQPYGQQPYGQQAYGQAPYGQPYAPGYPPQPGTNVMAILSLVFAFVFAPAGIVLGHLAKKQIRQTGEQGDVLATWGLVLSYIFTAFWIIGCCGGLVALMSASGSA